MKKQIKDEEKTISKLFAVGINYYKLFWIFYIGGIAGVLIETIWCIITNGYFEYRTALILEPFNPVYGVGAVIITLLLCNMKKCNDLVLYICSFVIGGIFECACSIFQETIFGIVSWVYKPSNLGILGNRTSLLYCILWGFLGVFWVRLIYPFLSNLIEKFPYKLGKVLTIIFSIVICIDIIFSSGALFRQKERRNSIPPKNNIDTFYDAHFSDDVLKLFYHNVTIID